MRGRSTSLFFNSFFASNINLIQRIVQVTMYIFIHNTNHFIAALFQPLRSHLIILFLIRFDVRITIDLNDKFCLCTIKVRDKSPDRMLATDLESQSTISDTRPDLCFGWRQRMPMIACQLQDGRDDFESRFLLHDRIFSLIPNPSPARRRGLIPSPEGRGLG